jgi:hypothetical protein
MAAEFLPGGPAPSESAAPAQAPAVDPSVSPTDSPTVSPSATTTAAPAPSLSPGPAATNSAPAPAPSDSTSGSTSPTSSTTKLGPHAIANQAMTIRTPAVVTVDPRARSVYLPQIAAFGADNLLVCISNSQLLFDIAGQNQIDPKKGVLIIGDQSTTLLASGVGSAPIALVNGQSGLQVISQNGGIANKSINLSFVALSEPSLNPALCGDGIPSNNRTISIQSIGLNVDMLKGDVTLKK